MKKGDTMNNKILRVLLYAVLAAGSVAYAAALILITAPIYPVQLPYVIALSVGCLFFVVTLGLLLLYKTETRSNKMLSVFTNLAMFGWIIYLICGGGYGVVVVALSGGELFWLYAPPLIIAGATLAICIGCFKRLKKVV